MTTAPALDMPAVRAHFDLIGTIRRHAEQDLLAPLHESSIAELKLADPALICAHFETVAASVADLKRKLAVSE